MVSRDIIQRLLAIINDTRARLNTLESREVALLTATQTLTNKTLTTPTIGNFTNAQHAHTGATSGGTISHSALTDLTTGDPHTQYLLESTYDANTILKADADDTPIALTVGASTIVGRAATGSIAALTAAQVATIVQGSIDHSQLTNLTTGDPHTQYLLESTYDANTILKADADDTPIALTVGASTIVGRASTGSIAALTAAQVATIVQGSIDHGSIAGLTDDDHTGYARLAGRSGGQTLIGGTAANDDLTLEGTSNATRTTSYVILQPTAGNVGIGTTSPVATLQVGSNRPTTINGSTGGIFTKGDSSGWTFGYHARGSSDTDLGGFGFLGSSDTLTYLYAGDSYSSPIMVWEKTTNRVGIGTTSPVATLQVGSNRPTTINGSTGGIFTKGDSSGWTFGYHARGSSNTDLGGFGFLGSSDTLTYLYAGDSHSSPIMVWEKTTNRVGIGTTSPSRKLHVAGTILIDGDEGSGIAGTIGLTDVNDATLSTGTGTVKLKGATIRDNAGFIKIYVGTTTAWVPYWTNIS